MPRPFAAVRPLLLIVLVVALSLPTAAGARLVPFVGGSTFAFTGPAGKAISARGITVSGVAPGKAIGAATFRLPVAIGFGDTKTYEGVLVHRGGLGLAKGPRAVSFVRLVAIWKSSTAEVWGQVSGKSVGCSGVNRSLKGFVGNRAVQAVLVAVHGICYRHRLILVGALIKPHRSVSYDSVDLSAQLRLSSPAAQLVNDVAAQHVVSRDSELGPVSTAFCVTGLCPEPPPALKKTTLGIFTPFVTGSVGPAQIISEANAVGVRTIRFSQQVSQPPRSDLAMFARAGKQVVLTINRGKNPAHPPATPAELAAYRKQLNALLGRIPTATAPVLQIENEELVPRFLDGTPAQYLDELNAAVDVGHAHGFKVTNGGIVYQPLELMVWQDYVNRGQIAEANAFAAKAFRSKPQVVKDLQATPFTGLHNMVLQSAWDRLKVMMPAFRASKIDYVNFHWYEDDDSLLTTTVSYLARATGKPIVTTELGQHNTTPSVVTGHLTTLIDKLHLPLVLWFDADGIPALGLHDAPGTLRPNGLAFKNYVDTHLSLLN